MSGVAASLTALDVTQQSGWFLLGQVQAATSTTAEVVLFWLFAVVGILAAIGMVVQRNVIHGALLLVLNFFTVAGMFLLLQSSFLALIQIIVYAGAIMVLFLFVLMLLGIDRDDLLIERRPLNRIAAFLFAAALAVVLILPFRGTYTAPSSVCSQGPTQQAAGAAEGVTCVGLTQQLQSAEGSPSFAAVRLFTRYDFAFEFVSLLLVTAIVAALVAGRRREDPDVPGGQPARELDRDAPTLDQIVDRVTVPFRSDESEAS